MVNLDVTSDRGGGATLVRLCLARMLLARSASAFRLHLQLSNRRRQMAPNRLSGGQQTAASAGATLDLLEQHFISLSRLHLRREKKK